MDPFALVWGAKIFLFRPNVSLHPLILPVAAGDLPFDRGKMVPLIHIKRISMCAVAHIDIRFMSLFLFVLREP
jgi:hypothetical protein